MDQGVSQPNQINGQNQPPAPTVSGAPINPPATTPPNPQATALFNPQAANPSSPSAASDTPPKKSKALIATAIVCAILALAGIAFGIYGMFLKPTPECEPCNNQTADDASTVQPRNPAEEQKTYQLSDYVTLSEVSTPVTFPDEVAKGHTEDMVKKIDLINLPSAVTVKFEDTQSSLIAGEQYVITRQNTAAATINGNILSVNTIFSYDSVYSDYGNSATLNIDLSEQTELTNQALLNRYDISADKMYESILEQLVQNVSTDTFLLNTEGDVNGPFISVTDFTQNIPEYKNTLSANPDAVQLYIDDSNKIHALYKQKDILNKLGMCTHMNIGLSGYVQDVSLQ